ncbi:MAG: nucleotidyltransferase domain-containing protein [Bacteroidetes bacterium]|nr:nucleotidyltransferase domain-containing protein [Bacteroidota bacterium]
MNIVEQNVEQVRNICRDHKVERMYVFGSVLTRKFNEKSDIDFLVKFGEVDLFYYFDNLLSLKENLENLLHKEVDILEEQALKNPYLKKSIDNNKVLIYGRETSEMVV